MEIKPEDFQIQAGVKVKLDKWPIEVKPAYTSKKAYPKLPDEQLAELSDLQRRLYAYCAEKLFCGGLRQRLGGFKPSNS